MARREVVEYTSDLSGNAIEGSSGSTVEFSLDGVSYEVDLTVDEQAELRDKLAPYVSHGTKATSSGKRFTRTTVAPDAKVIRAWAQAHGHAVPEKGRIPANIRELYESAHA